MLRTLPPLAEPEEWTLAFHRTSPYWWVRLLALGRYKHVSAFAWIRPYGMWVYFDVTLAGTRLWLLPNSEQATAWITSQTADADLVAVPRRPLTGGWPLIRPFYCVSALQTLTGVRGGALPIGFYRACLRAGGKRVGDNHAEIQPDHAGRPDQNAIQIQP